MYTQFKNILRFLSFFILLFETGCRFKTSTLDPYFAPGFHHSEATMTVTSISGSGSFGDVEIFQSSDITFTLTNSGDRRAEDISTSLTSTGFQFKNGTFPGTGGTCSSVLTGNSSCNFIITFSPLSFVSYASILTLTYANGANTTQTLNLALSGTGVSITPEISSLSPSSGTNAGGTSVTISGAYFRSGMTVTVGGVTCSSVSVISTTALTCTTGAHAVGYVDVIVSNNSAQSVTSTNGFAYVYPTGPTILSINPSRISVDGGTTITITGNNFISGATVTIGGNSCSSVTVNSSSSATCITPTGTDGTSVDLVWTNPGAVTDTLTNGITYAIENWTATTTSGAPSGRYSHTIIWTGSKAAVWGGTTNGSTYLNTGSLYDPTTDSWSATTTTGAPVATFIHSAIWSGSKMITWGSYTTTAPLIGASSGGQYDPILNSWTSVSISGAPTYTYGHSAIWSGSKMIVWGGHENSLTAPSDSMMNTPGIYDPIANTWTLGTTTGSIGGRIDHGAVWTGSKMIVWGGDDGAGITRDAMNTGALYDPVANTWSAVSTTSAPSARELMSTAWTGSKMVVWGGCTENSNLDPLNDGGIYDPTANSWTSITTINAPSRSSQTTIWTGSKMIIWSGFDTPARAIASRNTGSIYDPIADTWITMITINAPSRRVSSQAIWTGGKMIVFGGFHTSSFNTGGVYTPPADSATNTWTATTTTSAPSIRTGQTSVWSGSKMIVWGGSVAGPTVYYNTGSLYDPVTNSWTQATTTGAPAGRANSSSVWTGSKMVVWGGQIVSNLNTGGRYDPVLDSWQSTTTTGAPSARWVHGTVWTGSKMIITGGADTWSGGSYDPQTDIWTSTNSTSNYSRSNAMSVIWTGKEMIVWGGEGYDGTSGGLASLPGTRNTGQIYNPNADTWTAMATTSRQGTDYSAIVWTGNEMIIWGGYSFDFDITYNNGAKYNPATNTWSLTTTVGAPSNRDHLTGIWTGNEMIIWGGVDSSLGTPANIGGRYRPDLDRWTSISTTAQPSDRSNYSAIWTGGKMIIWGASSAINTGGIYTP